MTKHYLNDDGSRWYIKINNKSDELNSPFYDEIQWYNFPYYKFPYYVVFDEDIGIEGVYPTLKRLQEDEN